MVASYFALAIPGIEFKKILLALIIPALVFCVILSEMNTAFALTPVADLTGTWSGFAVVRNVEGTCEFSGKVNAHIKQDGNQISGDYSYVGTGAKPSSPDYYCYDFSYSENISGTIDGSRITLYSESGTFSGSYASSGISLSIQSSELVGSVKLSPTNFTPPPFESKNKPKQETQDVNEMVQTGVSYLNEKQFDKALEHFSKITTKEPNNIMGWMGKGVSYVGLKDYDKAITQFKKSLEINPGNKDVLQWLARTYYLKNDCKTSSDYYSSALRADPQNAKMLAEKKIVDSCLAKKTEAKSQTSKPETKKETTAKPEPVKADYASVKSALDKIKDPAARANRALEILKQLPEGPIPDDLQKLLANDLYGKLWLTSRDKASLIDKLPTLTKTVDGSVNVINPGAKAYGDKPVYFINGVYNSLQDSDDNAQALANLLERPVKRVYNKSDGKILDLLESGGLKVGLLKDNPAVQSLVKNIMTDLQKGETVEIHAHSEGAIITSVALGMIKDMDPGFFAKNAHLISVNTYGGGAWTYPGGPNYDHMTFVTDPVGWVPGRTLLAENLLLKTNPEKLFADGQIGLPGHAFTGYVQDKPQFLINKHTSFFMLDAEGLGKDLANYNPNMVSRVIAEVGLNHEEEVTYYFVKNLSDSQLKNLPKNQLSNLQKNLQFGFIKNTDDAQLVRLNKVLGIK